MTRMPTSFFSTSTKTALRLCWTRSPKASLLQTTQTPRLSSLALRRSLSIRISVISSASSLHSIRSAANSSFSRPASLPRSPFCCPPTRFNHQSTSSLLLFDTSGHVSVDTMTSTIATWSSKISLDRYLIWLVARPFTITCSVRHAWSSSNSSDWWVTAFELALMLSLTLSMPRRTI